MVAVDQWSIYDKSPSGHFVRALGKANSQDAEQESLLLEFDVPYRPFSQTVLDCLPVEGSDWRVPSYDPANPIWKGRSDLRSENICSIDPPGMLVCLPIFCFLISRQAVKT